MPSVAEAIAQRLAIGGSPFAFGHPGGEVVLLIDALRRSGVRFVLAHHETTAAFMAGGYGELTGRPGVCVATLGPGATNMVTGVASAYLERAPLIALTGALADSAPRGATHQQFDLNALYRPITKGSYAVTAGNAATVVDEALRVACADRPGPVHLSIPADVAAADAASTTMSEARPAARPRVSDEALAKAAGLLAGSRRPAIVAGIGAVRAGASSAIRDLARRSGAVVAVPPKAKGIVADDDPHWAGVLEMAGDDIVVELLRRADLIVVVGLDVVELDKPWRLDAPVIHVDVGPHAERYYPTELELVGDITDTLTRLSSSAISRGGWTDEELRAHREGLRSFLCGDGDRLQPWQVVDAVRAALPDTAIATSDVGAHKFLVGQLWKTPAPRLFYMANGLSSMGYAVPVAMAAGLTSPDRPTVAFVGDGGLSMYLGELETAKRLALDLLIVVFVDNSLELIRRSQLRRKVPTDGTAFTNPDIAAVSAAYGIWGRNVTTRDELHRTITAALHEKGLKIVAAHIDGGDYRL